MMKICSSSPISVMVERCWTSSRSEGSLSVFGGSLGECHRGLWPSTDMCVSDRSWSSNTQEHAKISRPLPESWVIRAFSQTLCAVAYCHMKGVVHKDLKFENLMLRKKVTCDSPVDEIHVVIIDVGMSELFGDRHGKDDRCKDFGGTLFTMAPEVWSQGSSARRALVECARAST